jgi:hypothetical protein
MNRDDDSAENSDEAKKAPADAGGQEPEAAVPQPLADDTETSLAGSTGSVAASETAAREDEPLPAWTAAYPADQRRYLSLFGIDPAFRPRGHEYNLRLMEFGDASDKAAPSLGGDPFSRWLFRRIMWAAPLQIWQGVEVAARASTFEQGEAFNHDPAAFPPARSPDQIEVCPDWLLMYPLEHRGALERFGVPTVLDSHVDQFNRAFVEQLDSHRVDDEKAAREALGTAFVRVFGAAGWFLDEVSDEPHGREIAWALASQDEDDLPEVCWATYPEEHRDFLRAHGRPDYEHPDAAAFNRALIAGRAFLRDSGDDGDERVSALRQRLWQAFFADLPVAA